MKRKLFICLLLVSYVSCFSQTTRYIGKGAMYCMNGGTPVLYTANITMEVENLGYRKAYASAINMLDPSYDGNFITYRSKYGDYISFNHLSQATVTHGLLNEQFVFLNFKGKKDSRYYAFVTNENKLCIVDIEKDEIVSSFENSISELSIVVINTEIRDVPIFILNSGGNMTVYNGFPNISSSVRSITNQPSAPEKTYTVGGIETNNPNNGIYIQDGKKVVIKQ